ncbi:hypothetical protein [Pararhodobacter oceanensis]|uniref:hypothetical protein n=1 Tax=Pararhodobacter oceanensis TaxID=2172121 RepID=UPI003A8FC1CD
MASQPSSGAVYGGKVWATFKRRAYRSQIASPGGGLAMRGDFVLIPRGAVHAVDELGSTFAGSARQHPFSTPTQ